MNFTKQGKALFDHMTIAVSKEGVEAAILEFIRDYPDLAFRVRTLGFGKISCPFPFECEQFPCSSLKCNADSLSNGHAYRMS